MWIVQVLNILIIWEDDHPRGGLAWGLDSILSLDLM